MKKIEAIIRKTKFEDVKEALLAADIEWFSYYDVRGEGKMRQARIYRGVMYDTSSIERVLLNVVVRDKNVEKTINAIQEAARTGEIGDGRIFVIPVEDTVRIRTGERGDIALYKWKSRGGYADYLHHSRPWARKATDSGIAVHRQPGHGGFHRKRGRESPG